MIKTPLEIIGSPLYYISGNAEAEGFATPPNPHGQSLRTWVRSLGGMQKEALVISAATGTAWRFASDEGLGLGGHNQAPNPLTYLSAGMIASYMTEITALAVPRSVALKNLELILENFYYREGDFRAGTMTSGALPPQLDVNCDADCDDQALNSLLYDAVSASPLNGLAHASHPSLFTLVHNGKILTPTEVTPLAADPFPNPGDKFANLKPAADSAVVEGLIDNMAESDERYQALMASVPAPPDVGPNRDLLHMHTGCRQRPDGLKEITKVQLHNDAPNWRFLSDEVTEVGSQSRAPDAASLISAGIGLCFMTQMGRFAKMARLALNGYSIIQDTHFSLGGASGGTGEPGFAQPVETHVYLNTDADDGVAQQILGVGEKTCFLHAFCREDVKPKVRAIRPARVA